LKYSTRVLNKFSRAAVIHQTYPDFGSHTVVTMKIIINI